MRVLVACEYSGIVRDAFISLGHDAMSCDLLPSDTDGPHYQGDVMDVIDNGWDMMLAFPPCTHLAVSGARYFSRKQAQQADALDFVRSLLDAPIDRIALENPVGIISSRIRKPDQIIQPWQFGHPETKATCLWLKGLPLLIPTNDVHNHMMTLPKAQRNRIHHLPPSPDRWKLRSATYAGIAQAMARQWSDASSVFQLDLIAS